jgi:anaerobic selenocysteine-containing dehydrogenase
VKGRSHAGLYGHPDRLLHPLKRLPDGSFQRISLDDAIGEIAERLRCLIEERGPRSVAMYPSSHNAFDHPANIAMAGAFMKALGSPKLFSVVTIDQPGKGISAAMHGIWMAPGHKHDPDVVLVVGGNPMISHQNQAAPPGDFIKDLSRRGGSLLVIDPRRTETAKRARIHLAPRPGEDPAILAGLLNIIIREGLHDQAFIAEHVTGFDELRRAVEPFTPEYVACRADIPEADLVEMARIFGRGPRGYVIAGTGPSMTAQSTIVEYLVKCLDTVCGHWLRAGERVYAVPSLFAYTPPRAQARPPFPAYGFGELMRVRGLVESMAGLPVAAAADEMLLPGDEQIRALLSLGGNPASSWPDQIKTVEAFRSLDLLVQTDVWMTTTAKLAHYVLPATLPYEAPGTNMMADCLPMFTPHWGLPLPLARYTKAMVQPPEGSEVSEQWEVLFRIAQEMGLQMTLLPGFGEDHGAKGVALDMSRVPNSDELIEFVMSGSRIDLAEIKEHPNGFYADDPIFVQPPEEDWAGRLDVGNIDMMNDLDEISALQPLNVLGFPYRLIARRMMHVFNTPTPGMPTNRPGYNPLFIHPLDLEELGAVEGELIEVRSRRAAVRAVASPDDTMRRKTVSMSHAWGGLPELEGDPHDGGASTARLIANDAEFERYSGQPRMSNVPVTLSLLPS